MFVSETMVKDKTKLWPVTGIFSWGCVQQNAKIWRSYQILFLSRFDIVLLYIITGSWIRIFLYRKLFSFKVVFCQLNKGDDWWWLYKYCEGMLNKIVVWQWTESWIFSVSISSVCKWRFWTNEKGLLVMKFSSRYLSFKIPF